MPLTNKEEKRLFEIVTLAKWLISIPSISTSKGESVIMNAIYTGIADFDYFKANPDHLFLISHDDQINSSIISLVKASTPTNDTIILLCNADTTNLENYGSLKSYAYKSDDILNKLLSLNLSENLKNSLNSEDNLFGHGVLESKGACATFLMLLKSFSDNLTELKANLILICTASTFDNNKGMKACLPYLEEIANKYHLNYRLAINAKPSLTSDDNYHIYTKTLGHICPCFYICTQQNDNENPYKNFSSSLIAAKLIETLELNPKITKNLSNFYTSLKLKNFYNKHSLSNINNILLKFKLDFFNLDHVALINELKKQCVHIFEKVASLLDDRESLYCQLTHSNFELDLIEAEVITYEELFSRAKKKYQGELDSALLALVNKSKEELLTQEETISSIIDRLIDLANLQKPAIVILLSDDYSPQQNFFESIAKERESIMRLNKLIDFRNKICDHKIEIEEIAYPSQDIAFLRPTAADSAIEVLKKQCPNFTNLFYNFDVATITLGINGDDLNQPSERINKKVLLHLYQFIDFVLKNFNNQNYEVNYNQQDLAPKEENDVATDETVDSQTAINNNELAS